MPTREFFCPVTLRPISTDEDMKASHNTILCPLCGSVHWYDSEFLFPLTERRPREPAAVDPSGDED